jgi:alkylhydroperoxidase family enzyme
MSWIKMINEEEAEGMLREIYDTVSHSRGQVGNILKVEGLNPEALDAHFELYKNLMFSRSPLTRKQRETLAVAVSAANHCHY